MSFDGFTKNWRYPGWRCTWVVGPKQVIDAVASTGSFLDGGGSKPLQRAALPLLEPAVVLQETTALQQAFRLKRKVMLKGLKAALDQRVICVPGEFFDVNPGKRRAGRPSRFRQYVRFSFGPELNAVKTGVERIQRMVNAAKD